MLRWVKVLAAPPGTSHSVDSDGWEKAAKYGCLYLIRAGLAKKPGSEMEITTAGEKLLDSTEIKGRFPEALGSDEV